MRTVSYTYTPAIPRMTPLLGQISKPLFTKTKDTHIELGGFGMLSTFFPRRRFVRRLPPYPPAVSRNQLGNSSEGVSYLAQYRTPKKMSNKKSRLIFTVHGNKKLRSRYYTEFTVELTNTQIRNPAWTSSPVSYFCRCLVLL